MTDETYQGWSNRETWAVNLHLSNDEGLCYEVNEFAEEAKAAAGWRTLADRLESWVSDELLSPAWWRDEMGTAMPEGIETMRSEVGSLWRVDWGEIAKAWLEN